MHVRQGSTIELAKFAFLYDPSSVFLGPIADIYVDRWNKKHTMIFCDLLRGFLVLLIPFIIAHSKSMVPIYIIVFVVFSVSRFFVPSKLSIIPDIVEKDKLLLANSLTSTTMMIATIVGYGFGGIIVALLGAEGGFYVDSLTYLVSAFMLSFVALRLKSMTKKKLSPREKLTRVMKKTVIEDIKEGLAYLKGHKDIRMVANAMFLLMAGVGSIYVIIIVFVQEVLHSSTEHLGFLAMFLGGGLFLGSVAYGRFGARLSKKIVINFGLSITGLAIAIFALGLKWWSNFFMAGLLSLFIGISASPIVVSSNTLLHEVMEDKMRGRIFSSVDIIMHIAFLIFMVLTSLMAELVSKVLILIIIGVVFSVIGLVKLMKSSRI